MGLRWRGGGPEGGGRGDQMSDLMRRRGEKNRSGGANKKEGVGIWDGLGKGWGA